MRWQKLEHDLHHWCQKAQIRGGKLLVACSGGADSVALLRALQRISSAADLEILVAHIHHGPGTHLLDRNEAQDFTKKLATELGLDFVSRQAREPLEESEESLREFRWSQLRILREENDCDFVVVGHHAGDLLETRLLRLLRGTGLFGLRAMGERDQEILRPLLKTDPKDLRSYLACLKQSYLEDPSNTAGNYLRNWMRQDWLPQLEVQRPGALGALARSLQLILEEAAESTANVLLNRALLGAGEIDRSVYMALSSEDQISALARAFRSCGQHRFTRGQLLELQRRLTGEGQRIHLRVASCEITVNAERILIHKQDS